MSLNSVAVRAQVWLDRAPLHCELCAWHGSSGEPTSYKGTSRGGRELSALSLAVSGNAIYRLPRLHFSDCDFGDRLASKKQVLVLLGVRDMWTYTLR